MSLQILLICLFNLNWFAPQEHDIHVSVTDVTIENKVGSLKVKIFYDDLQKAMGLIPGQPIPKKYKGGANLITMYIQKHVKISADHKEISLSYDKTLSSQPAVWAYFTFNSVTTSTSTLKIENKILTEIFDDQTNIVNINVNGNKMHYSLNSKNITAIFQIKNDKN